MTAKEWASWILFGSTQHVDKITDESTVVFPDRLIQAIEIIQHERSTHPSEVVR